MSVKIKWYKVVIMQIIMQIQVGQADAGINQLLFSWAWRDLTEFSPALDQRDVFIVVKKPGPRNRYESLAGTLELPVWIAIITSVCVFWVTLVLSRKMDPNMAKDDVFRLLSISLGVMINESVSPRLLSLGKSRVKHLLLVTWIPTSCFLGMAYQSNLLASLVKVSREKPIDTFPDLIEYDMPLFVLKGTLGSYLLAISPFPVVRSAYNKLAVDFDNVPGSIEVMKAKAEKGRGSFIEILMRFHGFKHRFQIGKHLTFYTAPCGYYRAMNNPVLDKTNELFQVKAVLVLLNFLCYFLNTYMHVL